MTKRPVRGKHSSHRLALPFVVTAAAATVAACSSPANHPTNPPPPNQVASEPHEEPTMDAGVTETQSHAADAGARPTPPYTISKNPPAPRTPPPIKELPTTAPPNGTVTRHQDGSCLWVETVPPLNCPEGMSCNPPPPRTMTVACPTETRRK